jgi:hypothetical protein
MLELGIRALPIPVSLKTECIAKERHRLMKVVHKNSNHSDHCLSTFGPSIVCLVLCSYFAYHSRQHVDGRLRDPSAPSHPRSQMRHEWPRGIAHTHPAGRRHSPCHRDLRLPESRNPSPSVGVGGRRSGRRS